VISSQKHPDEICFGDHGSNDGLIFIFSVGLIALATAQDYQLKDKDTLYIRLCGLEQISRLAQEQLHGFKG
jgi:hypothetical protein